MNKVYISRGKVVLKMKTFNKQKTFNRIVYKIFLNYKFR